MTPSLRKALAFIRRDFQIESSYKMSFVMNIVDSMMVLIFFYFLNQLVVRGQSRYLDRYGGNFLSFAVIGLAFARYFQLTLRMFSDSIRTAQLSGCLEAMLSSQTDALTIVLMSSLYGLLSGAVQPILILVAGSLIMGVDLSHMNLPATILVLAFSVLTFVAFGVLSAATILWIKKGDPLAWILGGMGTMLAGAYFPVDVLPEWLRQGLFPDSHHLFSRRLEIDNLKGVLVGNGRTSTSGVSFNGRNPTACQSGNFCCNGAKGSD